MRFIKILSFMVFVTAILFNVSAKQNENAKKTSASVSRQTSADNTSADSMEYDFKIEWKQFSSGEPVRAFVLTPRGVWYVTTAAVVFQSYERSGAHKEYASVGALAPASDVTCITADNSGAAWIGTTAGCARETNGTFAAYTTGEGLCDNDVKKIAIDNEGIVYAGTSGGLCSFVKGKWNTFNAGSGFNARTVFDVVVDQNNTVWCATNNGVWALSGGKWQSFTSDKGLSYDDVHALAIDPVNGNIWAAAGEKDVNCYNGKQWKVYMDILDNIVAVMVDTQSRIWFGSSTAGLVKFNGDEWINDPRKNGISAAQVNGLQRDSKGNLWFATDKGLLCMNNPYPY